MMADYNRNNPDTIKDLYSWARTISFTDEAYFSKLANLTENRLMERIWKTVNSYCKASGYEFSIKDRKQYVIMAALLENGQKDEALEAYEQIRNIQ